MEGAIPAYVMKAKIVDIGTYWVGRGGSCIHLKLSLDEFMTFYFIVLYFHSP